MRAATKKATYYDKKWESEFPWVHACRDNKCSAYCSLCKKSFSLSNMGRVALTSHAKSRGHAELQNTAASCQSMRSFCSTSASSDQAQPTAVSTKDDEKGSAERAEVIWIFFMILNHFSFRSATGAANCFTAMFPDSAIAKAMSIGYDKARYVILFGLAPYFKEQLLRLLNDMRFFSVSFDESLNKVTQHSQMDLHVRFWQNDYNDAASEPPVKTAYFDSQFLLSCKATDLLQSFLAALKDVPVAKVLQVGMDGPNVNLAFFKLLNAHVENSNDGRIIQCGSCSLHRVHGALKNGMKATGWDIEELLRSLHYLFKDSPARRNDFIGATGTHVFPLKFCACRWLENIPVVQRAVDIWPDLCTYVEAALQTKSMKTHINGNRHFELLQSSARSPLQTAKFQFFLFVGKPFNDFLTDFQTESPMLPFLADRIHALFLTLLQIVLKPEALQQLSTIQQFCLHNSDILDDEANLLPAGSLLIGTATLAILAKAKISDLQKLGFRKDIKNCVLSIAKNLLKKCPLNFPFVRFSRCLQPSVLLSDLDCDPRLPSSAQSDFDQLVLELYTKGRMSAQEADSAKLEFCHFRSVTARERRSQLAEFKYKTDRLDVMLASLLDCQSSSNLLLVVKMVLTTFHANAAVERGFSVNKECMEPNLQELSIQSLRIVYDSLKSKPAAEGLKEVPEEMLKYVRSARKKYRDVLERQRAEDDHRRYEASKKRKAERTAELQSKRKKLLADASVLTKDADSLVYKCEETSDMSLIVKSNALRRAAKQKLDEADQVQKDIVSINSTLPI